MLLVFVALAACSGCAPDFTMPWEVNDPRVLAGRVEVEGDPTRSGPKLGESFRIRLFMATPRKPKQAFDKRYDVRLELCIGVKLANGALACGGIDGSEGSFQFQGKTELVSDEEIVLSGLTVPSELSNLPPPFDQLDRIALFGAVCVDGKVQRVPGKTVNEDPTTELFRCTGNEGADYPDPLVFTLSVLLDLGRPGDGNHQPSFVCEGQPGSGDACRAGVQEKDPEERVAGSFVLVRPKDEKNPDKPRESIPWDARKDADDPTAVPWEDCVNSGLPLVHIADGKHIVRVRFDARDRETYAYEYIHKNELEKGTEREELEIAHALTDLGGKLERYFSVLERDVPDSQAEISFDYTPPGDNGEAADTLTQKGRLVRFYFVARDERGGVDYTVRELCLLPKGK
jgi:hypothetical protein